MEQVQIVLFVFRISKYFICDVIYAICVDTTAANTGRNNGTNVILARVLQKPFLWLSFHQHISELTIKVCYQAVTGEKTVGPTRKYSQMYCQHQVQQNNSKKINESVLQVGSELHRIYLDSKSFISYALEHEVFSRGDYQHLVFSLAFVMNIKSTKLDNFKINQPEADAKFMASAIYMIMLDITSLVFDYLTESQTR